MAGFIVLAVGGYFLGRSVSSTPSPSETSQATPPSTETTPPAGGQTAPLKKTVTAGLDASSGLSFTEYSLQVPDDWTVTKDDQPSVPVDTLLLTKGEYQIKIFQAATGGAMCLYPGSPAFEGPSSSFDNFLELTTPDSIVLRRSGTTAAGSGTRGFTVCQKASDSTFQQPTGFGHTSYKTPLTPDEAILKEMDSMIATLTKQ